MKLPPLAPTVALILGSLCVTPRSALGQASVGGYFGTEFDNSDHWLLFGGEARFRPGAMSSAFQINPRLSYHPYSGASVIQLDLNLLYNLELAHPNHFLPYAGAGVAYYRLSAGGFKENHLGLNLAGGTRIVIDPASRLQPFAHAQYTIIRGVPNSYTLSVGLSYALSGASAPARAKKPSRSRD